jgi:nucleoside-diphosphate-sugar epimerase
MTAIMVTGGLGYSGRHIVRALSRAGRQVVSYNRDYAEANEPNVTMVQGELYDIPRIARTIEQHAITGIIHTAAMSHPDLSIDLPITTVAANIEGTVHLLEAAKLAGVKRFVNFSSEVVFGHVDGPVTESTPFAPTTPYGVTKAATEMFARVYNSLYGMDIVSLRLTEIYGPGNKMPEIMRDILKAVLAGQKFRMATGGDHGFHFIHVEDVAAAAIRALDCPRPPSDVYNIAGGPQCRLSDLAAMIKRLIPAADIEIGGGHWHLDRQGPWDQSAAARDLGYRPGRRLEDGVREYRDWLQVHEY